MTTIDPAGYSKAGADIFIWLADQAPGGIRGRFGRRWERAQWAAAQDRYDQRIIEDYGQIRIFGQTTPWSLNDIPTNVYALDRSTADRRFHSGARHLWDEDSNLSHQGNEHISGEQLLSEGRRFMILGKPGAGKTTFLKRLAVREAQRGRWGPCLGKIPIFVSLLQLRETRKPLFDLIVEEFGVCRFPHAARFVETLLKSGQALVLFDGLDEASTPDEVHRRGEAGHVLWQFARQYSECHIVISCRFAGFEYSFGPDFRYLEMAGFGPDQVEAFVHAWFQDESQPDKGAALAEGMLAEWQRPGHQGIRDLGGNPLLLTLLCLGYAETLDFPARLGKIYEGAMDALLKRWDASRRVPRSGLYERLSPGRKQQMFARIAFDALARGKIVFHQSDLERWLVEYLANVPELPEAVDIDGEAVLREIVVQHGIFAEQAHRLFSFAHLTLQEYFAARHVADNEAAGASSLLLDLAWNNKWREVFLFTTSLLPDASPFLAAFEGRLYGLAAARPRLLAWLNRIAVHAAGSQAGYRPPATRLFYAEAFALDRRVGLNLSRARAFARALDIALALDLDLDRDRALGFALTSALYDGKVELLDLCRRQGRTDLSETIEALATPDAGAPAQAWEHYAAGLEQVGEALGTLTRYRQLEAEVHALRQGRTADERFDRADFEALGAYTKAAQLFYDCLQVACTPDRRAFEDRIFLPPP